jgi:hypothetical protein
MRLATEVACTSGPLSKVLNMSSNDITQPSADQKASAGLSLLDEACFAQGTDLSIETSLVGGRRGSTHRMSEPTQILNSSFRSLTAFS